MKAFKNKKLTFLIFMFVKTSTYVQGKVKNFTSDLIQFLFELETIL